MDDNIVQKYTHPNGTVYWRGTPEVQKAIYPHFTRTDRQGGRLTTYVNPNQICEFAINTITFKDGTRFVFKCSLKKYLSVTSKSLIWHSSLTALTNARYFRGLMDENTFLRALLRRLSSESIPPRQFIAKNTKKHTKAQNRTLFRETSSMSYEAMIIIFWMKFPKATLCKLQVPGLFRRIPSTCVFL